MKSENKKGIMSSLEQHKPRREVNGLSLYYIDSIAVLVMNNGENKLNDDFLDSFHTMLDDVEGEDTCVGLITTGVGKFYSTGLDLPWLLKRSPEEIERFFISLWQFWRRLMVFPVPTVAAINGHCFAGGAILAFAHDLRTMKDEGRGWICLNEVFINRRFPKSTLSLVQAKLGAGPNGHNALVLAFRYTAQEALRAGIVHTVTSEALLIKESARVIEGLHVKQLLPRDSLVNMKRDVYELVLQDLDTDVDRAMSVFKSLL
ncbi:enoyl-CoA delta isomerase 2, peroxisomal [Aplysia californica]|uniref:Enoyl-CoA delta isomerase 2, peroxisomal n=1 Tax=Aplysia californica TaxID=6500 RepID=A0ABM1VR53_APLCA|nr:enoyl-CoA delta isomerase 2, peroxisomal [Aplysia californica]